MRKTYSISGEYLYIPVNTKAKEKNVSFFIQEEEKAAEKWTQYRIAADESAGTEYSYDFMAELPIGRFKGKKLIIEGDVPESFLEHISISDKKDLPCASHSVIHFTIPRGWSNDPNGLVYQNGIYHFYYQYNPFNLVWGNMSWGHAVSKDLLHWEQKDMVMFPDEEGTVYSGCGLVNERGMLDLPNDALLFYYTVAGGCNAWSEGKPFTQKIAYSLDGGETLIRMKEVCIPEVAHENRDPKIFWHEETQAYIMVLYLRGDEYAVFRSTDLKEWEQTQVIHLEDAWECPDLFCLTSEEGETCWFFWAADGFYYAGDFNGYQFAVFQEKHHAYLTKLPYAAQTYSNTGDRIISIPWIRSKNEGKNYTGTYGIPVELSFEKTEENEFLLIQKPVKELYGQMKPIRDERFVDNVNKFIYNGKECNHALVVKLQLNSQVCGDHAWKVNGMKMEYSALSGTFIAGAERIMAGYGFSEVMLIVDDGILEVFFDNGRRYGVFELQDDRTSFEIDKDMVEICEFYEVM